MAAKRRKGVLGDDPNELLQRALKESEEKAKTQKSEVALKGKMTPAERKKIKSEEANKEYKMAKLKAGKKAESVNFGDKEKEVAHLEREIKKKAKEMDDAPKVQEYEIDENEARETIKSLIDEIPEPSDIPEPQIDELTGEVLEPEYLVDEVTDKSAGDVIVKEKKRKSKKVDLIGKDTTKDEPKDEDILETLSRKEKEATKKSKVEQVATKEVKPKASETPKKKTTKPTSTEKVAVKEKKVSIKEEPKEEIDKKAQRRAAVRNNRNEEKAKEAKKSNRKIYVKEQEYYENTLDKLMFLMSFLLIAIGAVLDLYGLYVLLWLGEKPSMFIPTIILVIGLILMRIMIKSKRSDYIWDDFNDSVKDTFKKIRNEGDDDE